MTSKERFAAACAHTNPDRVPINYLAQPDIDARIREFCGVTTERELLDTLGCDFYFVSCRDISQNETCFPIYRGPALPMTATERTCPFGIRFHRKAGAGKFAADETIRGPLESATTPAEILRHPWPKPEWFDMDPLVAECEQFSDKVIIGGFWSGIFGDSFRMHGYANFLLNMAVAPALIHTLVNRMTDFYLELNNRAFSALKGKLDVWFFGNDFGTQNGLMFSENMWREYFFPNIKRMTALAHSHGLKVMMHSCGGIRPLIGHLIEAGVDMLDPVQTTAVGMNPLALKQEFGDRLIFHGAIDTQRVLPTRSPDEVYAHGVEMIETLGPNGGYVYASCNSLQSDTPVANIAAMYKAAREHRLCSIKLN